MKHEIPFEELSGFQFADRTMPPAVYMPFSCTVRHDSGGLLGTNPAESLSPHIYLPLEALASMHASVRGSVPADIVEMVQHDHTTRNSLETSFPYTFCRELSDFWAPWRWLLQRKIRTEDERQKITKRILTGSDYDVLVDTDNLSEITQLGGQLKDNALHYYDADTHNVGLASYSDERGDTVHDIWTGKRIRLLPRDNPLLMLAYLRGHITEGRELESWNLVIQVKTGKRLNNGLPFADYQIQARQFMEPFRDSLNLFSMSISASPSSLSEEQLSRDTRLSGISHSWDRLGTAQLVRRVPQEFISSPTIPAMATQFRNIRKVTMSKSGLFVPEVSGEWSTQDSFSEYAIKTATHTSNKPENCGQLPGPTYPTKETFIYLPNETVACLTAPLEFGPDFGQDQPVEFIFQEFIRSARKVVRLGTLADNETTRNAFTLVNNPDFAAKVAAMKGRNKPELWETAVKAELITALFYAPRELIKIGNAAGFERYFPQWKYLSTVANDLPDRKTMRAHFHEQNVTTAQRLHQNSDGLRNLLGAIRERYSKDPEVRRKKPLELLMWLVTT